MRSGAVPGRGIRGAMGFFALLGSMFFGVMLFGGIFTLIIILVIISGFRRLRSRRGGGSGMPGSGHSGYSTGSSYRRYTVYQQEAAGSSSRASSRPFNPNVGRQTTVGPDAGSRREVVEVPLIEVADVTDDDRR